MNETLRVLVVDDEPGMRSGTARALGNFTVDLPDVNGKVQFAIEQAESGEEALGRVAESPPDLLLDHKLPGVSGLDVLARLGESWPDVPVVMITAYASLETAISATKRGAYDFLAKPFTPDELRGAVTKAARHVMLQRQARRLAHEKRQVRFQFISVLAHELKAPLAAVEGYLSILKTRSAGPDPAVYEHMLDRALLRTAHMRKMIIDLLDLTRIESGQKKRELVELDVVELARSAVETQTAEAATRDVTMEVRATGQASMKADRGEAEMILNNLLSNAVKYNRQGGRVEVRVEAETDRVRIEVEDTGIGMKPEEAGTLFGEFVRIKNDKTREIFGSGLGLSIVKKLVQAYDGQVKVKSEPGVGTTFTVELRK